MPAHFLACDLGAESGRLMLGTLQEGKLALKEIHRFPNTPLKVDGSLHWDILKLFDELKTGMRKAAPPNFRSPASARIRGEWTMRSLPQMAH